MTQLKNFFIYISFIGYLFSQQNSNQSLSINIPSGVGIEVSGEVEVEFINVEGKGGAQYRDEFIQKVDVITFEFENIPFETLNEMNKFKPVLPKPSINRLIQHRLAEKDFVNKLNIRTTRYVSIEKKDDLETLVDFLPGILKTTTMGYDGKGQYPIKTAEDINSLNIDLNKSIKFIF